MSEPTPAWGPRRVLAGVLALVAAAIVEAGAVSAVAPPPGFEPVAVAPGGGGDVLALNADDDRVWTLERDDDALERGDEIAVTAGADHLASADLDGDGDHDLAVARASRSSIELFDAASGRRQGGLGLPAGEDVRALAAGDLDGDGDGDIAVGSLGGRVRAFLLGPDGDEVEERLVTLGEGLPAALAAGDLDGDGDGDLALARADGRVAVLVGAGGGLRSGAELDTGAAPRSLAIGDFDSEPGAELAVAGDDDAVALLHLDGAKLRAAGNLDLEEPPLALAAGGEAGGLAVADEADVVSVVERERDGDVDTARRYESELPIGARLVLQGLLAATLLGVAAWIAASPAGSRWGALGLRRPRGSPWKLAALGYLAYIGAALAIAALIAPEQQDIARELGFGEGLGVNVATGALIVAAAPLSEEVFFRGLVFGGLRRRAPFVVAALASAAIWGLFHFTGAGSWGVVLQLSVFGVVLAWLYERTGSIWPPIAVHTVNNVLAFTILTTT